MTVWSDLPLSADAVRVLEKSAILPHIAERAGIRSVTQRSDLPETLEWFSFHRCDEKCEKKNKGPKCGPSLPGILYTWTNIDGVQVPQYAPLAKPHAHKYAGPKGEVVGIDVIQRGDGEQLWIVEGTKQHLAAASYAPEGVTVLGIAGAHSWGKRGAPFPGLELCEDKQVFIAFDADVSSNDHVKSGAEGLVAACLKLGAADVRICSVPQVEGDRKTGLDDYLAANGAGAREVRMARLIEGAAYTNDGRTLGERLQDREDGKRVTVRVLEQRLSACKAAADKADAEVVAAAKPTKTLTRKAQRAQEAVEQAQGLLDKLMTAIGTGAIRAADSDRVMWTLVNQLDANVDSVVRFIGEASRGEARALRLKRTMRLGSHVELAERLIRRISWGGDEVVNTGGTFYGYDRASGAWGTISPSDLYEHTKAMDGLQYSHLNAQGEEVFADKRINDSDHKGIHNLAAISVQNDDFFSDAAHGIAFRNGFLLVGEDGSTTFAPHAASNRAVSVQPFDYSPDPPDPTRWYQFLSEVWGEDHESINLLHMMMGYLLTRDTSHQKAFVLLGPPASGKGTILNVLNAILGKNATSFNMPRIGNEFGCSGLIGKNVAIDADFRRSTGRDKDEGAAVAQLLKVVANDTVTIGIKNKADFNGKLGLRVVIAANPPFGLRDAGNGLERRWCILPFSRSFAGNPDPGLADKLLAELPGIIHLAIAGLKMLREEGKFTEPESARQLREDIATTASPMSAFVRDCCVLESDAKAPAQQLYQNMQVWARAVGRTAGARDTFKQALQSMGVIERRDNVVSLTGARGRGARYYAGIRLDDAAFDEFRNGDERQGRYGARSNYDDT